jgi:hypothetical protein
MKRTPGKTTASKEKYWEKIIEAARRYPQGITQYCRVMNVSKDNYYQRFKRLRAKHPEWHDLSNRPEIIASHLLFSATSGLFLNSVGIAWARKASNVICAIYPQNILM